MNEVASDCLFTLLQYVGAVEELFQLQLVSHSWQECLSLPAAAQIWKTIGTTRFPALKLLRDVNNADPRFWRTVILSYLRYSARMKDDEWGYAGYASEFLTVEDHLPLHSFSVHVQREVVNAMKQVANKWTPTQDQVPWFCSAWKWSVSHSAEDQLWKVCPNDRYNYCIDRAIIVPSAVYLYRCLCLWKYGLNRNVDWYKLNFDVVLKHVESGAVYPIHEWKGCPRMGGINDTCGVEITQQIRDDISELLNLISAPWFTPRVTTKKFPPKSEFTLPFDLPGTRIEECVFRKHQQEKACWSICTPPSPPPLKLVDLVWSGECWKENQGNQEEEQVKFSTPSSMAVYRFLSAFRAEVLDHWEGQGEEDEEDVVWSLWLKLGVQEEEGKEADKPTFLHVYDREGMLCAESTIPCQESCELLDVFMRRDFTIGYDGTLAGSIA